MRSEMKQKSHIGHLGIKSCPRRARNQIFWPGMFAEIRQYAQAWTTCATYADRQPAEPFITTEVPKKLVADNIFFMGCKWISSHSGSAEQIFEVDKLSNSTSDALISRLRGHFARYGIPDTLVSDNRPQFSSHGFRKFSRDWAFMRETISPGNSQANGTVEAAVKIMKCPMRKCKA